jgi:hypothetical protein
MEHLGTWELRSSEPSLSQETLFFDNRVSYEQQGPRQVHRRCILLTCRIMA